MNAKHQLASDPRQPKSRSGPESFSLSPCPGCFKKDSSMRWRGDDGESSSSAEDSGPEADCDSETESSSSSCCSARALPEISEEPETEKLSAESVDAADPESRGEEDGERRDEMGETSENQDDKRRTKGVTRPAPLVKSFSLPASFTPHLIPLSMLPRPHTVVSTLHLQVLSQKHDDDAFYIVKRHLFGRGDEKREGSVGGGQERVRNMQPPQMMGLPWQQGSQSTSRHHQLSYQYQQQQHQQLQHQHFPPLTAQSQGLPPCTHTHHVLHPLTPQQVPEAPPTHLHAPAPQPCWCCHSVSSPYSPSWGPYCSGHLPR